MTRVAGIDPGIRGGLAILSNDGLLVERMPIIRVGKQSRIDISSIREIIYAWIPDIVVIEEQCVMPKQGIVSGFLTGLNYGSLLGYLSAMRIPIEEVRPTIWKKALRVTANKDDARYRAQQLFPNNASDFAKKSSDGLAEAALLAYYYKTRGNC